MGKNDLLELALNKGIRPAATTVEQIVPREQDPQPFNAECAGAFNNDLAAISAERTSFNPGVYECQKLTEVQETVPYKATEGTRYE